MTDSDTEVHRIVAHEIAALHVEFEQWFQGDLEDLDRVRAALADDFTFISPQGDVVQVAQLLSGLEAAKGSRNIRIRVENPTVRWQTSDAVLATYEEWHEHPDYQTGRLTTALFSLDGSAPGGVQWRHVHETWLEPPPTRAIPDTGG